MEITRPQRHFVVQEKFIREPIWTKKTLLVWRTVMLPDLDMEGNECERANYHTTMESAQKLIETLKEPVIKYHY